MRKSIEDRLKDTHKNFCDYEVAKAQRRTNFYRGGMRRNPQPQNTGLKKYSQEEVRQMLRSLA